MANGYDGEVRINTRLSTEGFIKGINNMSSQSVRLANQINAAEKEVEKLNAEAKKLGDTKVPTAEYEALDKSLKKAEESLKKAEYAQENFSGEKLTYTSEYRELSDLVDRTSVSLDKLYEKQNRMNETGVRRNSSAWKNTQYDIEQLEKQLEYYKADLQDTVDRQRVLEASAAWIKIQDQVKQARKEVDKYKQGMHTLEGEKGAFTQGYETDAYKDKVLQLEKATAKLREYDAKVKEIAVKEERLSKSVKNIGSAAVKAFGATQSVLSKVNDLLNKLGGTARKVFKSMHKDTQKQNTIFAMLKSRLGGIALSLMVFNWITRGFNSLVNGIKEGFKNLVQYSEEYNKSVSELMNANTKMKNSFATAFQPIVELIIPYLVKLINYVTDAVNVVTQLFAVLSGKDSWIRAKKVNEDYSESLDGVADSAKDAEKAVKGYLSPIDELNKYQSEKSKLSPGDMFETVPIENSIKEMAEKIKSILSKLFEPLKEAWSHEGKFVIDSWKYALNEVGKLFKDIGSDFIKVWNQEATVKIFEDILHIIGDIGLVVGNLASNFRAAWSENEVGKRILENIRDLIGIIVANICDAADYTVEWSKNLNFTPLLEAFERFTESLKPVVDFLSGVLTDFYEQVLLPLAQWALEEGLPDLLDVFTAFNDRVDWVGLRERLKEFWDHLAPFAQTVGEGLILFIERCSIAVADFIESEAFNNFLTKIEEWMDEVKPEDVADAFETVIKSIIGLKIALFGFKIVSGITGAVKTIKDFFDLFSGGGKAAAAGKGMGSTSGFLGGLAKSIGYFLSTANPGMIGEIGLALERFLQGSMWDTSTWTGIPEKINDWFNGLIDSFMQGIGKIIYDTFNIKNTMAWFDEAYKNFKKGGWNILLGIVDGFVAAFIVIPEIIVNFFTGFWNALCDTFDMHSPAKSMEPIGENILRGIIEGFVSKVSEFAVAIKNWFDETVTPWFTKEKWSGIIANIKSAFETKWGELVNWWKGTAIVGWWNEHVAPWFTLEKWKSIFENIKKSLSEKWGETVGQWKTSIANWWNENVLPWFTKEKWKEVLQNIVSTFSDIFDDIVSTVYDKMGAAYDKVSWWIDKIKGIISSIWDSITAVADKVGSTLFGGKSSYRFYNVSAPVPAFNNNLKIPGYATGTVIPPSMSRHLAYLGDNNRETEVVSPLSTIERALSNALGKSQSGGGNYHFTAQINRKTLFDEFISEAKMQQMVTGRNPFELS